MTEVIRRGGGGGGLIVGLLSVGSADCINFVNKQENTPGVRLLVESHLPYLYGTDNEKFLSVYFIKEIENFLS